MILFGTFTKFGAAFAIIPEPIIGGIYCVMFGIITGVGISSAQFVDLNSPRNLFILGFSIFFGLAFPTWISNHNPIINTGRDILNSLSFTIMRSAIQSCEY